MKYPGTTKTCASCKHSNANKDGEFKQLFRFVFDEGEQYIACTQPFCSYTEKKGLLLWTKPRKCFEPK